MNPAHHGSPERAHVIIVGAGPVGLSAALLLARSGIASTVLERDAAPSTHPKARGIRPRTMELFMQWGIADPLYAIALPEEANRFIYCDTLAGEEIARTGEVESHGPAMTLARACRVAQDSALRAILDAVAAEPLVTLRTGAAVAAIEQDGAEVRAVEASGAVHRGDYLIGADGAASSVRRILGIAMEGVPLIGYGQSIYWRGDLAQWTADRLCIQFHTGARSGHPASVASVDGHDRWITMVMQPPSESRPEPPNPEEAQEIIARAVGAPVDAEILDITTWRISAQLAERWQEGRVFLAGDAAHTFPPTGGFGMNTGVQDAHNLAWKLAAVLAGTADPALVESYAEERKPVAASNAAWSAENGARFRRISSAIAAGDAAALAEQIEEQRGHVDASEQDLAFRYESGALDGEDPNTGLATSEARLGCRFPETVLQIGGESRSSNTDPAEGFRIVVADRGLAEAAGAVLDGLRLPGSAAIADPAVLGRAGSAIVRPDGIIAWCGDAVPGEWEAALGRILGPRP
ncbi:MAG: FAD-dependent monooxygenase [Leucobacter sp.]